MDLKISQLPVFTGSPVASDLFVIVNSGVTKSTTMSNLFGNIKDSDFALVDNIDLSKKVVFQVSGVSPATTRTLTIPNASGTIALTSQIPSVAITLNIIPKGTGTGIVDGTWAFSGNDLIPVTSVSNIGSLAKKVDLIVGSTAIDLSNSYLINSSTIATVDWENGGLFDNSANASLAWFGRYGNDSSANISFSWEDRLAYSFIGIQEISIDWQNRLLVDNSGATRLDWENTVLQGNWQLAGNFLITGAITIFDGTQGNGKVLVSDSVGNASWATLGSLGAGTVTSVSVVTNQGVSGSVATATTTPAITLTLGALTGVTSFNGLVITANTGVITTGTWSATAIAADKGGTGQTVYAVGDLLYASTTTALSKLADVATGSVLISGGVSTAPAWSASPTLTTSLTVPLLIGGTAVGSSVEIRATSGVGSSEFIKFTGGNNGATEYARFINAGGLVIGATTTIFSELLSIQKNQNAGTSFVISNTNASGSSDTFFSMRNGTAATTYFNYGTGWTTAGTYDFANGGALTQNGAGGLSIATTHASGVMRFYTGGTPTEAYRVDTSQNFGIGATTVSAKLHIIKTTEQLRVGYDASNYYSTTVGSTGIVTFDAVGAGSKFIFSDNIELTQTVTTEVVVSDRTATIVINGTTYKILLKS